MELATYLKEKLTGITSYEWSIDISGSNSTYINYIYGTEEQEDDGCDVSATIRFADHNRPSVVSDGGVFDHNYMKDFRLENDIQKGYVDAVLMYMDDLILEAQNDLTNDGNGYISWSSNDFVSVMDELKEDEEYDTALLFLEEGN